MDIDNKLENAYKKTPYITRSKAKKYGIKHKHLLGNISISPTNIDEEYDDDVDEYGNLKGFIDYSKIKITKLDSILIDYMKECENDVIDNSKKFNKKIKDWNTWYSSKEESYLCDIKESEAKIIGLKEIELKNFNSKLIPLRFRIIKSNLSMKNKALIIQRIDNLNELDSSDNEYHKLKQWINGLYNIPFDTLIHPPISISNTKNEIRSYLENVYEILDNAVYGHKDAKVSLLQSIAQNISNPSAIGSIIGLCGPMGNGKTSLVRKGVSKALGRPFSHISLGGSQDASFLNGFDYTYEGSRCGRILDILKESKCMNPIIYFDELDKVSQTAKGMEIFNLLCHLMDSSQNDCYQDKFYLGLDFDLSKATIICSFNDATKINPILRDRINIINMKGFNTQDKINIVKNYLLPEICNNYSFNIDNIKLTDNCIRHIIDNYTQEEGVRTLKKCIEMIIGKLNMMKLTNINKKSSISHLMPFSSVLFPIELTPSKIDKCIKMFDTNINHMIASIYT